MVWSMDIFNLKYLNRNAVKNQIMYIAVQSLTIARRAYSFVDSSYLQYLNRYAVKNQIMYIAVNL